MQEVKIFAIIFACSTGNLSLILFLQKSKGRSEFLDQAEAYPFINIVSV
jgi:hypothetical protein